MEFTRSQIAALIALHRDGRLEPYRPPVPRGGTSSDTTAALIGTGLACSSVEDGTYGVLPALQPWADGFGAWHVRVSGIDLTDDGAPIARAVILGELQARESNVSPRRVRVEYINDATCAACGQSVAPDDGGAIWYHPGNMSAFCDGDDSTDLSRQASPTSLHYREVTR